MSERIVINSQGSMSKAIGKVSALFQQHKYLVLTVRTGRDRTVDQNALWFALYKRISQMTQIGDEHDARKHCKLYFGVPIMLRDSDEYRNAWARYFHHLTAEEHLEMMGACTIFGAEGYAVTRLFDRKQGIEYTDAIVSGFTQQGVFFGDLLEGEAA